MLTFLKANFLTIVVSLILLIIVGLIIYSIVKDKKAGKGCCGGDCSRCQASCTHKQ